MSSDMEEFNAEVSRTLARSLVGNSQDSWVNISSAPPAVKSAEDKAALPGNHTMWAVAGDSYFPCETTCKTLPPGQYLIQHSQAQGIYFQKKTVTLDGLLQLPDTNMKRVIDSIEYFWDRESAFREHGFLWKRGIMLYGPPGSGKTSLLQRLSQRIIERGGISIYGTIPQLDSEGLRIVRKIEPHRPIVMMIEDIDSVTQSHGESHLLAMLDGELQVDNIVFIATTNYPGRLDRRLINRPSRFDEVIKIGMPTSEARMAYLLAKNPKLINDPAKMQHWVDKTDGLSLAHLRELVVAVECLGNDAEATIDRLRAMNDIQLPDSAEEAIRNEKRIFGFTNQAQAACVGSR
jgi:SpoVK/Ycf46/Vps4 family AAA+-type ATPase